MLLSPDNIHILGQGIDSWKLWSFLVTSFATIVIGGYRGFQWIKSIRDKDFPEVKAGLETVAQKIEDTSAAQVRSTEYKTTAVGRELAELRGLLYGAFHIPSPVAAAVRSKPKRKSPAEKTTKKPV